MEKKRMSDQPLKRDYYNHKDAGNAFLYGFVFCYAIALLATLIAMSIVSSQGGDPNTLEDNLALNILTSILTPVTFIAVFFLYTKKSKISFTAAKIKFNLNWKTVLLLISISILCIFGLQYIIAGVNKGLVALGYSLTEFSLPFDNAGWYILNLIILAVLPAIGEELIFRGIIFNGLKRNVSDIGAILISASLFTIMHGSLDQFVYPFILGIIFAWLVLRTGSILSSIIVHMCNNALAVTIQYIAVKTGFDFMPQQEWLFWILAVALMLITFAILFIIDKFYFKKSKLDVEKVEKNSEGRVPSLTMIVGIAISLLIFVINVVTKFLPTTT